MSVKNMKSMQHQYVKDLLQNPEPHLVLQYSKLQTFDREMRRTDFSLRIMKTYLVKMCVRGLHQQDQA